MRRQILLVGAWLGGGLLAVTVATVAVGEVGDEVTGSRPAPLSASEVREELAEATTTSTTSTTQADPGSTSTSTTVAEPSSTTSTTAPPRPPTTSAQGETRTYALVGGTATLRFEPGGVTVVAATPKPGFDVEVEPHAPNGVEVSFESETHRSKVEAWWAGVPVDEVDEDASR